LLQDKGKRKEIVLAQQMTKRTVDNYLRETQKAGGIYLEKYAAFIPDADAKNNGALKPRLKAQSKMGLRHALHESQEFRAASSFQPSQGKFSVQ